MGNEKTRWEKIGVVGVNSGTVVIADPADFLEPGTRGHGLLIRAYDEECTAVSNTRLFKAWEEPWRSAQDPGSSFIFSRSGYGDGAYDVFAKVVDDGNGERVMELRIMFDYAVGFDKPGGEVHDIPMKEQFEKLVERDREEASNA